MLPRAAEDTRRGTEVSSMGWFEAGERQGFRTRRSNQRGLVNGRRPRLGYPLAVVLPLLVALAFPHPTSRLVVPESIMVAISVLLTVLYGPAEGLISALLAPFYLWVFNVAPPLTFEFAYTGDVVAIMTTGAITCGLVVVVEMLTRRERRATEQGLRLDDEVASQRNIITALQHALLPDGEPAVPGLEIGWHYVPGGVPSVPVGGDWLAFVPIGTKVGIAIGDVAGHGLPAVRAMAECRVALKVLASDGADPSTVLGRLDTAVSRLGDQSFSTCLFGVIDIDERTWTYASAGHPPPLLRRRGHTHVLAAPHGPPIGADLWRAGALPSTVVALDEDDLIALYTDGLVERRDAAIDVGITTLANRIDQTGTHPDLSGTSRVIIEDVVGTCPPDDVAVVLIAYRSTRARR
jgi:hypothetical protein